MPKENRIVQEQAEVLCHESVAGGYRLLALAAPRATPRVQPGQFVHLRIPGAEQALLRRPFSIYRADDGRITLLYKQVGVGTEAMTRLQPGQPINLLGPLGHGFPRPDPVKTPLLMAGGYGAAALYLVAQRAPMRGVVFIGGRNRVDILCAGDFQRLGWEVRITTDDGSLGRRGLVTDEVDAWLQTTGAACVPEYFACGPNPMLKAICERALARGHTAWISMDRHMGCGVGACLACVQKIRALDGSGWEWLRVCKEGPVFEARAIVWD